MGITAIISLLGGILSGAVPKFFDIWTKSQDHKYEMDVRRMEMQFREKDHQWAIERAEKETSLKLDETYYDALQEENRANREQAVALMQEAFKPTGFWFIDMWNGALRPAFCSFVMVLFCLSVFSSITGMTTINPVFAGHMADLFAFTVEAVISFLFGYRATVKAPSVAIPR